jgi:aspartyl protease family protein
LRYPNVERQPPDQQSITMNENDNSNRTSTAWMVMFWVAFGAVLWVFFSWYEGQRAAVRAPVMSGGDIVIVRSADGHFHVPGTVGGVAVDFLVDTGASGVAVSDEVAQQANLKGGQTITVYTANGTRPGKLFTDGTVSIGAGEALATASQVEITSGLDMGRDDQGDRQNQRPKALLGQSFLSRFDVSIQGSEMRLKARP